VASYNFCSSKIFLSVFHDKPAPAPFLENKAAQGLNGLDIYLFGYGIKIA
jgi:hypothetical protein